MLWYNGRVICPSLPAAGGLYKRKRRSMEFMKRIYFGLAFVGRAILALISGAASMTASAVYPSGGSSIASGAQKQQGAPASTLHAAAHTSLGAGRPAANGPAGAATPTCAPAATPGPWTLASPLPQALESTNADADAAKAYDAGGYDGTGGTVVAQFSRFDPVANSWTSLAPIPTAADGPATVYSPI